MPRILIVDDEPKIAELINKYATFEGYDTVEVNDGMKAIEICKVEDFDIIVMDIMMPELDGFSAVREIRKTKDTPVIMLSARGEEYDRIHGFEVGADDYVVKPFSPKELMMRVEAILKRTQNKSDKDKENIINIDGINIDLAARILRIDGNIVSLTPKEYDLLTFLIENQGIALSREKIISTVWGYDYYGDDRTLDTHIKLLRKNLGPYSNRIVTLRGVGYRFEKEE
ncbi:response regulator transcription factor [Anaerofustis stercorihominis]|uniref:response regulator transcription factor n=1 Tax=Anaerofustis stercorihominis TaxID=214853 RepID=UPI00214CA476|nr:response regulator transcription factor [Anaerofustis stercorihominis]MCR2032287.1 response regulator transcription factor [Anaerofustis stercorihominis]